MDATTIRTIFTSMKTTFPNSLKTVAYGGRTATGIVPSLSFPAALSMSGNEQGLETEKITVDSNDLSKPSPGDEIVVGSRAAISDAARLDPTGALIMIEFHYQKPVVIDTQEIG